MNELESYLQATLETTEGNDWNDCIHVVSRLTIGDQSTWRTRKDWLLKHPTRKGEVVGCIMRPNEWFEFTASFVRECFEASKDGKNQLIGFINSNLTTM